MNTEKSADEVEKWHISSSSFNWHKTAHYCSIELTCVDAHLFAMFDGLNTAASLIFKKAKEFSHELHSTLGISQKALRRSVFPLSRYYAIIAQWFVFLTHSILAMDK